MGRVHINGKKFCKMLSTHDIRLLAIYKIEKRCVFIQLSTPKQNKIFYVYIPKTFYLNIKSDKMYTLYPLKESISRQSTFMYDIRGENMDTSCVCVSSKSITLILSENICKSYLINMNLESAPKKIPKPERIVDNIEQEISKLTDDILPNFGTELDLESVDPDILDDNVVVNLEFNDSSGESVKKIAPLIDKIAKDKIVTYSDPILSENSNNLDDALFVLGHIYYTINISDFYDCIKTNVSEFENNIINIVNMFDSNIVKYSRERVLHIQSLFKSIVEKATNHIETLETQDRHLAAHCEKLQNATNEIQVALDKLKHDKRRQDKIPPLQEKQRQTIELLTKVQTRRLYLQDRMHEILANYTIVLNTARYI